MESIFTNFPSRERKNRDLNCVNGTEDDGESKSFSKGR